MWSFVKKIGGKTMQEYADDSICQCTERETQPLNGRVNTPFFELIRIRRGQNQSVHLLPQKKEHPAFCARRRLCMRRQAMCHSMVGEVNCIKV